MRPPAPKIDKRRAEDLLYFLIQSIPLHFSEWKKKEDIPGDRDLALVLADDRRDFGMALLKLAARMGEILIEQLNRVPDKNFLAFLDLVGIDLSPPKSARVPLIFSLAERAPSNVSVVVPKWTKVGVAGVEDVVFETEEDLAVSRALLERAYTINPANDRYSNLEALLTAADAEGKAVFTDSDATSSWPLIDHILYLAHERLFALAAASDVPVTITLALSGESVHVQWQYYDAQNWISVGEPTDAATVTFKITQIKEAIIKGYDRRGEEIERLGYWIRAKSAKPLPPDPAQLPAISSIQVRVSVTDDSHSPDLVFFNNLAVDTSKDFFPFGERPKFNDTLYIAWSEAFSKPGAIITINAALSALAAVPPQRVKLVWEYYDRKTETWAVLGETTEDGVSQPTGPHGFFDTTNAFTKDGSIGFKCPAMAAVAVNEQENYWVRVRIVGGGYGEEAKYETTTEEQLKAMLSSTDLTVEQRNRVVLSLKNAGLVDTARYIPATFSPPSLKSLALKYEYNERAQSGLTILTVNDFIYQDVSNTIPFQPFVRPAEQRRSLYIGFDESRPFQGSPLNLFFDVIQPHYGQTGLADAGPNPSAPIVVWRYWDGQAWARLPVEDETRNFVESGRVRLIAPANLSSRLAFGERLVWLKASLEEGVFATPPRLGAIYLNTVWASHGVTLKDQTLGSSNGERNQSFTFAKAPVLKGEAIDVREASLPSAMERARIYAEEGAEAIRTVKDAAGNVLEVWVRWHAVDHFNLSGPADRHYVADRVRGVLLFGDGVRGLIPPSGKDNIRAPFYRSGGGKAGNRPAGVITELKTTIPFVDAVVNHQPSDGGSDQEDVKDVLIRGPRHIKSRDRAITKEDFEWLAHQAAGEIAKARCLPTTRLAAGNLQGDSPGWVTIIIVPAGEMAEPLPTEGLIRTVKDYLARYASSTIVEQIDVIGPSYVRIAVEATVVPRNIEEAKAVEKRVSENLAAFLHPVRGGPEGEGWEFGKDVYFSQVAALIQGTDGVDRVRDVILKTAEGEMKDHVPIPENGLPSSGEHVIRSLGA
jgi:hypothetical protein